MGAPSPTHPPRPAQVFFSYAPEDRDLRDALIKHLALMRREGLLRAWHDEMIPPGAPFRPALEQQIDAADLILLLVSADYSASDECFERQMLRALARRERGEAHVVPILLRPCDWESAPFAELTPLPKNREPVTRWPDRDEAFMDIAAGIRRALAPAAGPEVPAPPPAAKPGRWQAPAIAAALLLAAVAALRGWTRPEPGAQPAPSAPMSASAAAHTEAAPPAPSPSPAEAPSADEGHRGRGQFAHRHRHQPEETMSRAGRRLLPQRVQPCQRLSRRHRSRGLRQRRSSRSRRPTARRAQAPT
jgi:hypothetical protein